MGKKGRIMEFSAVMYLLGIISLILAPFSAGISVVTAAAFFVIGYIMDNR